MSRDYRQEYEIIRASIEAKKQAVLEARGHFMALEAREQEMRAELIALGGGNFEQLEAELAAEEQAVEQLFSALRQQVCQPPPQTVLPPPAAPSNAEARQPLSLDELLARGTVA